MAGVGGKRRNPGDDWILSARSNLSQFVTLSDSSGLSKISIDHVRFGMETSSN